MTITQKYAKRVAKNGAKRVVIHYEQAHQSPALIILARTKIVASRAEASTRNSAHFDIAVSSLDPPLFRGKVRLVILR